jgi:predicted CXXCH cytochrome family protein
VCNKLFKYYIPLFFILLLLYACSATSGYKVRSFLFDGVPDPNEIILVSTDSLLTVSDSINATAATIKKPDIYIHQPYANKECSSCHDRGAMGKPIMAMPQLCYQCHDTQESQHTVLHGPVAAGQCVECHSPHQSKLEKLLLREGQDLCLNCHEDQSVIGQGIHAQIKEESCTQCHNPHGGNDRFVLQKDACFTCHDSNIIQNKYVHGPVGSRQCNVCHENHDSTSENLLVIQGNNLCLNCHKAADVFKLKQHETNKKTDCISCHNPHSGNNKYLTLNLKNTP